MGSKFLVWLLKYDVRINCIGGPGSYAPTYEPPEEKSTYYYLELALESTLKRKGTDLLRNRMLVTKYKFLFLIFLHPNISDFYF